MVHIVRKEKKLKEGVCVYLYLQRSIYKDGKRSTEHVAYLGPERDWTPEQIADEIKKYDEVGKK